MVECNLAKVEVGGSNPLSRSILSFTSSGGKGWRMKLNIKALSLTVAIVWGGSILLVGLGNLMVNTYGVAFLEVAASIYPGYQAASSLGDVIVGTLYGLVDGLLGGLIIGWVYNRLVPESSVSAA